jgi:hypothetical protein
VDSFVFAFHSSLHIPCLLLGREVEIDIQQYADKPVEARVPLLRGQGSGDVVIIGGFVDSNMLGRAGFLGWHEGKYSPAVPDSKYCVNFM